VLSNHNPNVKKYVRTLSTTFAKRTQQGHFRSVTQQAFRNGRGTVRRGAIQGSASGLEAMLHHFKRRIQLRPTPSKFPSLATTLPGHRRLTIGIWHANLFPNRRFDLLGSRAQGSLVLRQWDVDEHSPYTGSFGNCVMCIVD